ncbi:MAG: YihA family ribosome biogenesis GTP-binding protein [Endozoicomonadaceae bacterium]|nr:YihA family ribosome biogenesis GTP-binding protein [Endozoicomonadaceae bacterium]
MTIDYDKAHYLISAAKYKQCPDMKWEVAFVGRSNAGKSSALNALTRQSHLARTSKTPGRTQCINFFEIEPGHCLVDLPGYGYAKVAKHIKSAWDIELNQYLNYRTALKGLVIVMDIRHIFNALDVTVLDWALKNNRTGIHLLLTKSDKLSYSRAKSQLFSLQKQCEPYGSRVSIQLFSALKKQGIQELKDRLNTF